MSALCFYFQVHQPYRLRHYTFFDIGVDSFYEDEDANCGIMLKVARKCYLPMNALLLKLIRKYDGRFKVSFSISGTALDQFEAYAPEVIQSFRELVATGCVELLSETYNHSLAFLYSPEEFREQVRRLQEENRTLEEKVAEITAAVATSRERIAALGGEISAKTEEQDRCEAKVTVLRQEEKSCNSRKESLSGELARLEERYSAMTAESDSITAKMWD